MTQTIPLPPAQRAMLATLAAQVDAAQKRLDLAVEAMLLGTLTPAQLAGATASVVADGLQVDTPDAAA